MCGKLLFLVLPVSSGQPSCFGVKRASRGKAFLPLIASTSGRLHGEFVRFLYFLAHKRAMDFFAAIGQAHPSHNELCQQRGAFFYQHRSRVGVACAQACALRIGGAAPPRRQAPLQGANAHALQEDLDANWGG